MNFVSLLLPTNGAASTGPGSKTGSGPGASGFEQLLLGLLGPVPQTAGGQVQTAAAQFTAAANAATGGAAAALLNGTQAAAQAAAPQVGLVEAAAKAAATGVTAAQTATGEAGKGAATVTGAVSEALLKNGLPGAQTPPAATPTTPNTTETTLAQTAAATAQTVEQAKQQAIAAAQGAAKAATSTAQQAATAAQSAAAASLPAATQTAQAAVRNTINAGANAVSQVTNTAATAANTAASAVTNVAQTTTAAVAATGVAAATVKPATATVGGTNETAAKTDAAPASLITSTAEVATAKATIQSAVIQAPGAGGEKNGSASGKNKGPNTAAANLQTTRAAPPQAGDSVAQQAQAATIKSAQHPSSVDTAASTRPADSFGHQASSLAASSVEITPVAGTASPGTPLGIDSTAAANVAARNGAPAFVPVAEQVALQFSRALASGTDHITIRLEPESLGRVDVQVELTKDGRLTAMFIADRPETLDMLQRDARVLERALNDAGLRADSGGLSFNLRSDGGDLPQFANHTGGSDKYDPSTNAGDGEIAPVARQAALNADALLDIQV